MVEQTERNGERERKRKVNLIHLLPPQQFKVFPHEDISTHSTIEDSTGRMGPIVSAFVQWEAR